MTPDLTIKMITRLLADQQKLFDSFFEDSAEIKAVITDLTSQAKPPKLARLYRLLVEAFIYTAGSDQSNQGYYSRQKQKPTFYGIRQALTTATCPKLTSFEAFIKCGYRKAAKTCSTPDLLTTCPLPRLDMKKGGLNQMAFSVYLFLRDVCHNDFYGFVRGHFGDGKADKRNLSESLHGFLSQLTRIANVGPKLIDMTFSHLFFTRLPGWDYREIGARMVAIDTLVHNFLARTGILGAYNHLHPYGPKCHTPAGCLGVIEAIAAKIDCRKYNKTYPVYFPRYIQYQIWNFCAMNGENVCNGNKCKGDRPNPSCPLRQAGYCDLSPKGQSAQSEAFLFDMSA